MTCQARLGRRKAVELVADINPHAGIRLTRHHVGMRGKPDLGGRHCLLDLNEHFLELSNPGEERRAATVASAAGIAALACGVVVWILSVFNAARGASSSTGAWPLIAITLLLAGCLGWSWKRFVTPCCFTYLRARYRFNRTDGCVYVLRPERYGGHVILDWSRVEAHVRWCAPRGMRHRDLGDPVARHARQQVRRRASYVRGLVLYWPPLDPEDPGRQGEDVLWVGPNGAGQGLWEYIRVFMEHGIEKVPEPRESEWLRKGRHRMFEQIEERETDGKERRGATRRHPLADAIVAGSHCLAERLCSWPSFPPEWNSDAGKLRREHGIGPEEPRRWKAVSVDGCSVSLLEAEWILEKEALEKGVHGRKFG